MKKVIVFILFSILVGGIFAFGDVKFEVVYTDEPGEGFHRYPEAKRALEEAVALVGSWLDHDAVARIKVRAAERDIDALGRVVSLAFKDFITPGIYHTHLARKILHNEQAGNWGYDAIIEVNFVNTPLPYAYGDEVNDEEYDFKSLIIHELTHALGFISLIDEEYEENIEFLESLYLYYRHPEREIKNSKHAEIINFLIKEEGSVELILLNYTLVINDSESFMYFDTFLVDHNGDKVVDMKTFKFLRKDIYKRDDEDLDKYLYFRINKNDTHYSYYLLNGLDTSHLHYYAWRDNKVIMVPHMPLGLRPREWSEFERDIMQALGYKLKPVKED